MRRTLLLTVALPLVLGSHAAAQACAGMPSFSNGQMQIAAGGSFADGASSFGGTFGYGAPAGLYGKAAVGSTSYDGLDGSSFDYGVSGGYQIALKSARKAELCPIASLSLASGPNDVLEPSSPMGMLMLGFTLKRELKTNPVPRVSRA